MPQNMMTLPAAFDLYPWCRPKFRGFIAGALIVIALCDVSRALPGEVSLWVDGENGSDLNNCTELSPCKEIQAAISKVPPPGMFAWIKVAGWLGTYAAVDLSHHKTVSVVGDCNDPSQVKVASLTAQDFVVLIVQCLSTPSVAARQHAVLDVDRVHFSGNLRLPLECNGQQPDQLRGRRCNQGRRSSRTFSRREQFFHFGDERCQHSKRSIIRLLCHCGEQFSHCVRRRERERALWFGVAWNERRL
jgi:hypothetical protein